MTRNNNNNNNDRRACTRCYGSGRGTRSIMVHIMLYIIMTRSPLRRICLSIYRTQQYVVRSRPRRP